MKITRIEHIAYELDGKRFIEGKIERIKEVAWDKRFELLHQISSDKVDAKMENMELAKWKKTGSDDLDPDDLIF